MVHESVEYLNPKLSALYSVFKSAYNTSCLPLPPMHRVLPVCWYHTYEVPRSSQGWCHCLVICRAPGFLVSSSCFSFTAQLHSAQILWGLCFCCKWVCQSIQLFLVKVSVSLKETPMCTAEHYVHLVILDWYQDPSPRLRLDHGPSILSATEWDQHRVSTLGYGVPHNQSNGHGSSSFLALVTRKLMLSALVPWPPWNCHAQLPADFWSGCSLGSTSSVCHITGVLYSLFIYSQFPWGRTLFSV